MDSSRAASQMRSLVSLATVRSLMHLLLPSAEPGAAQQQIPTLRATAFCRFLSLPLSLPALQSETRLALAVNPELVPRLWYSCLKVRNRAGRIRCCAAALLGCSGGLEVWNAGSSSLLRAVCRHPAEWHDQDRAVKVLPLSFLDPHPLAKLELDLNGVNDYSCPGYPGFQVAAWLDDEDTTSAEAVPWKHPTGAAVRKSTHSHPCSDNPQARKPSPPPHRP